MNEAMLLLARLALLWLQLLKKKYRGGKGIGPIEGSSNTFQRKSGELKLSK